MVKLDLLDLWIPVELDFIKSNTKLSCRHLVKIKSKEYCLVKLLEETEKYSKMENLFYTELKMQDYLKSNKFSTSEAKMVFSWRTRMANFNENYRGSNGHTPCPLCHFHLDSQVMAFQCQELTANVNISGKHADIFNEGIPLMLVQSITKMMKYRETFLQERKLMN